MEVKKILIVEDEFITSKDLKEMLSEMGYQVIGIAVTGEEAIQKAKNDQPDLILMDIMLRGNMTGIEASKTINMTMDIPIIFLTAYSDIKTFEKAKDTEPSSYIVKPVTNENDLRTTIELTLHNHQKKKEEKQKYEKVLEETEDRLEKSEKKFDQIKQLLQIDSPSTETSLSSSLNKSIKIDFEDLFQDPNLPKWFNALGNSDRFHMVKYIKEKPRKINELENLLNKARTTVKHHLTTLENLGIIIGKISGKYIHFSLTKNLDFLSDRNAENYPECFDALSNTDRMKVLEFLRKSPSTIPEIENLIEKSQASVSHHLRILETCGLIMIQKKGRSNYYSLENERLTKMFSFYQHWKNLS
ncbi:Regulator of RpoS [Candidatus Lokiarchaeum ossiferum]|uniref:Regulator of RpoS n=1 Tax=Candidatus Lokiarchaeum ossiferum TaxID=2951803 RepID=A0ABY6HYR7_9ARCH|nr:Regulator of RpoS [Candidatus Lokiarchaeum sp. B-35]